MRLSAIDMSHQRAASACHDVQLRERTMDFFMTVAAERVGRVAAMSI